MSINPTDKKQRGEFRTRAASGDPIRDWYDERDLVEALEAAFSHIDLLEVNAAENIKFWINFRQILPHEFTIADK